MVGGLLEDGETISITDCLFLILIGCKCNSPFEAVVGLLAATEERVALGSFFILAIL